MAYIGVQPKAGQYRKLDSISGSFNGSTTSFTMQVSGQTVTAATAQQLMVSLGGVVQNPGTDYTVSTSTITFTTAPTSGLSFFAILMGDALNVGTPSDGTVTSAKLGSSLTLAGRTTVAASLGTVSALGTVTTDQALDLATANNFSMTLGGNITLDSPSNISAGQCGAVVITQDGTGSRTMTFNTIWKFPSGSIPSLSTAANAIDVLVYYVESATRITAKVLLDVKNP